MLPCLLAAAALASGAGATAQTRDFPTAAAPVLEDRFPQVPVAFPDGVKAYRDVTYQTLPGYRPQIVDIYVPAGAGPHPLILYIHGGGWIGGHTRHSGALADFPKVLARLAAEGFVVASLEYRLSGEAAFPAQLQDSNAALRFLRAHATDYQIDPAKVGVWGGSAGGHLAALTAVTCRDTTLDPKAAADGCVQAAVTWYGVFDFAGMNATPDGNAAGARLLGCQGSCPADRIRAVSPVTYIDAKDPPFLLIHGDEDKVVPVAQSHKGEAALRAAGVRVQSIYLPAVDHSFIGADAAATRAATLRATNATFDFFHQQLGVPRR
ncbi:Acetyl esterase/lipase [Sphingomonas guangdongensis]|uniref:Acetyl esterase/lipase n=1 Tax=Sphingomonas guangdongensis TaxID=1141890 RepID=A0A285QAJ0_9SPHN|nr:alpha/beta hydrolase [Sphingomonas guangdongensis]SOB78504.1 Acetyl esterase/lipase [Sphingomonas guangdongensis]